MEDTIIEILKKVLETENVNSDSDQDNTENWDSLHQLNLVVELEDAFDVSLEPEDIAEMKSVKAIERIINSKL